MGYYLDFRTGRFLNRDPIGTAGGDIEQVRARCAGPIGGEEIEEFASALLYYLNAID